MSVHCFFPFVRDKRLWRMVCCVCAEGGYSGDGAQEQLCQARQVDRAVDLIGSRPDEDWVSMLQLRQQQRLKLVYRNSLQPASPILSPCFVDVDNTNSEQTSLKTLKPGRAS